MWLGYWLLHICDNQSHNIEVAQGGILMEKKIIIGLFLGPLAILKRNGGQVWANLRVFFSCFHAQFFFNLFKNIAASALKSCIICFCWYIFYFEFLLNFFWFFLAQYIQLEFKINCVLLYWRLLWVCNDFGDNWCKLCSIFWHSSDLRSIS